MKKLITATLKSLLYLAFISCSSFTFSQENGVISQEVRAKMDENKSLGINIYSGIATSYTFSTEGLNVDEHSILMARAEDLESIKGIEFNENGKVKVECLGGTPMDSVKRIFSDLVSNVSSIEIENYLIQNN